jgi:hypothetical protein
MSQQLTVKQQTQLEKIVKAGETSELSFARKTIEFDKIRKLSEQDVNDGLAMVFTKASNLLGIKDPISDINKQDIREMILSHFNGLSLEEIDYAFKLERYGILGDKTGHFQLLNTDYVSTILNKYKNWLKEIRINNNLPISIMEKIKEPTQEEKDNLIYMGVINCFEEFKQTKKILNGYVWVYDHLDELGILKYSNDEKNKIMPIAKDRLINENKETMEFKAFSQFTKELENKRVDQAIINTAKKMLLERYFLKLLVLEKHIKTELK